MTFAISPMEPHPHLHHFNPAKSWKYLILGTFPPNSALRQEFYLDYFYGNKGFLWRIIHDIYIEKGYDFFGGTRKKNLSEIMRWQNDYCVGLTDTIKSCTRKHPLSSDDSDLTDIIYNEDLKSYILNNLKRIRSIIFTSSFGKNSAYENFRTIMGSDLDKTAEKLVIGLPSPSGSSNITFFNTNNEKTLGLTDDFFNYVSLFHPGLLREFEERWRIKKMRRSAKPDKRADIIVPSTPKGLVKQYKNWKYRQALPSDKCV